MAAASSGRIRSSSESDSFAKLGDGGGGGDTIAGASFPFKIIGCGRGMSDLRIYWTHNQKLINSYYFLLFLNPKNNNISETFYSPYEPFRALTSGLCQSQWPSLLMRFAFWLWKALLILLRPVLCTLKLLARIHLNDDVYILPLSFIYHYIGGLTRMWLVFPGLVYHIFIIVDMLLLYFIIYGLFPTLLTLVISSRCKHNWRHGASAHIGWCRQYSLHGFEIYSREFSTDVRCENAKHSPGKLVDCPDQFRWLRNPLGWSLPKNQQNIKTSKTQNSNTNDVYLYILHQQTITCTSYNNIYMNTKKRTLKII